jgi:hypothetical protein
LAVRDHEGKKVWHRISGPVTNAGLGVDRLHELLSGTSTPPPEYGKRCESCSLLDTCLPQTAEKKNRVENYLARMTAL